MIPSSDAAAAARRLLRRARSASLSTLMAATGAGANGGRAGGGAAGWPYGSLVTMACDTDGSPILLLSRLADHTRNLLADARGTLLIEEASRRANPQSGPRVSLIGRIGHSDAACEPRHRRRFLARHPSAAGYAGFTDFAIYRMTVERAHYVGGFAQARRLEGGAVTCGAAAARAIAEAEPTVIDNMNRHHAEAVALYARHLLGRRGGGWQLVAVDPDGCDLRAGAALARLEFPRQASDAAALRAILAELAQAARLAAGEGTG